MICLTGGGNSGFRQIGNSGIYDSTNRVKSIESDTIRQIVDKYRAGPPRVPIRQIGWLYLIDLIGSNLEKKVGQNEKKKCPFTKHQSARMVHELCMIGRSTSSTYM